MVLGRSPDAIGTTTHVRTHSRAHDGPVLQCADEAQRVGRLLKTVTAAVGGDDQLGVGEAVAKADRERSACLFRVGRTSGRTDRRRDTSGFREAGSGEGRERERHGQQPEEAGRETVACVHRAMVSVEMAREAV
jgi:hypothetical protein